MQWEIEIKYSSRAICQRKLVSLSSRTHLKVYNLPAYETNDIFISFIPHVLRIWDVMHKIHYYKSEKL